MFNIKSLFNKDANTDSAPHSRKEVVAMRSWYEERYETTLIQRNLLAIFAVICAIVVVLSVISVTKIATSKKFDPFVIQVEESTGLARVVTQANTDALSMDDSLTRYFIKRYLIARETYNPVDFGKQATTVIKLLSSGPIFWGYRIYINNKENDPSVRYGQNNSTYLKIRSWSKIEDKKYIVRFVVHENSGEGKSYNKIAIIEYDYVAMELKEAERDINPVGFQITGYRVDDDNS
jgi:type IV secretion system protein VirB8